MRPQSMLAQRVNGDRQSFLQSHSSPAPRNSQRPSSTIVKATHKSVENSALYPKEPPQKRSSFEKQRPLSTNLGFKKLSLREEMDEPILPPPHLGSKPHTPVKSGSYNEVQYVSGTIPQFSPSTPGSVPQPVGGFRSRFVDSDSENESEIPPFSSRDSRSTQPSSRYEPVPPPQAPYNQPKTLRPVQDSTMHSEEVHTEKKKGTFNKIKKLFGRKKH